MEVISSILKEAHWITSKIDYQKYSMGKKVGEYYSLNIPENVIPPKKGDKLIIEGVNVVVSDVSTPMDIAKGRGGPVAKNMEENGICWRVNCLPEGHEYLNGNN